MSRWRVTFAAIVVLALLAAGRLVVLAVVAGDSMAPTIVRGDVCVVARFGSVREGDIVLYKESGARRPVLHRVVLVHQDGSVTTRGDANDVADQRTVPRNAVVGRVVRVVSVGRALRLASDS